MKALLIAALVAGGTQVIASAAFAQKPFAVGADISWTTEQEANGYSFANAKGEEREAFALLKETGCNATRIRVWVNPKDGYNGKTDVLAKAKRAKAAGLKVMVDFHYSDWWADPGQQTKPEAWRDLDRKPLAKALFRHTGDILRTLTDEGVDVAWVEIGNEIRSGLLWDADPMKSGATWNAPNAAENQKNFALFLKAAALAVRKVSPQAKVIVHCDGGANWEALDWIAGLVKDVDYDIFGVSIYPTREWEANVAACADNLQRISEKYGKKTMVCEFGMPANAPDASEAAWREMMRRCRALPTCRGLFYWEPFAFDGWKGYGLGAAKVNEKKISPYYPFTSQRKANK